MENNVTHMVLAVIDVVVSSFRLGNNKEAFEHLDRLILLLGHFMQSMGEGTSKLPEIAALNDFINEMMKALENKDYVYVCDILKYGMRPLISRA